MAIWNREKETLSRDEYAKIQLEGLKKSLRRVWSNEFYRERLFKGGVSSPEDVKTLDDLKNLPFFTKEDFRQAYPLKMNCSARKDLMEMHMSSGSTGTPVVMAYTKNDLSQWAECMARCFTMAGLKKGDTFQIMPTFGLFNGGFGCYHGCRKAGLFCVPASSGNTERQIKLMRDFRTKGFCSVVSYVPRIIEKLDAEEKGDRDIPSLRVGIFGSETFSDEMRRRIESRLHIECFDIYGMTETGGIGTTGQDCRAHAGLHVWEDQYITEIVDPVSGKLIKTNSSASMNGMEVLVEINENTGIYDMSGVTGEKGIAAEPMQGDRREISAMKNSSLPDAVDMLNEGDVLIKTRDRAGTEDVDKVGVVNKYKENDPYSSCNVTKEEIAKYHDKVNGKSAVLANGSTASAAELFTCALMDYGISEVVGTTTYGKGSMQSIFSLAYYGFDGGVKMTTKKYFPPISEGYDGIGIKPDLEVELDKALENKNIYKITDAEDNQIQAAIDLIGK